MGLTGYDELMTLLWHHDFKTPVTPLKIFHITGYLNKNYIKTVTKSKLNL